MIDYDNLPSELRELLNNPYYREKLTEEQILAVIDEVMSGREADIAALNEIDLSEEKLLFERFRYIDPNTYLTYERLGDSLKDSNANQAYLCYENAIFLCKNTDEKQRIGDKLSRIQVNAAVKKACFVILSYNNAYLMQKCIESIFINCNPNSYSIVVVDNASTDGIYEWLKEQRGKDFKVIRNDANFGFAAGCNLGALNAPANEDIFFLNNDTRITANALFWMRMALYSTTEVGAVGGVQNYSSSQKIDISFDVPEQYMEFGAHNNVHTDNAYCAVSKLSGFALLVRRNIFEKIGGFDEDFSPGYFEDDDLCYRIREGGYRLLKVNNAFIYHVGSQSFANRDDLNEVFEKNRAHFIEKWGYDSGIRISDIKLIIWDLDNTYWDGILSEGDINPIQQNADFVSMAVDKGIMNSICSKNDYESVAKHLDMSLFVFPSIDWTPKAARIKQIITDMSLREENVLFIDDEAYNRNEALYEMPRLMVASPNVISGLLLELNNYPKSDLEHERLGHYRLLEQKRSAMAESESSEAFLKASEISVSYNTDCIDNIDRICELIERTNQLNYTKIRCDRDEVTKLLNNPDIECAVVKVTDKYGDYGIAGFYALDVKANRLIHFLFSCRVLGMGIEQYTYQKLNFPILEVSGDVAITLLENDKVDWVTENIYKSVDQAHNLNSIKDDKPKPKVLMKGPCDISAMVAFLESNFDIDLETNFVDSRNIVVAGSNNSMHIYEACTAPADAIRRLISDAPFMSEADYITYMFDEHYDAVIFSTLSEVHSGIYMHNDTGLRMAFGSCNFDLTNSANMDKYIAGEVPDHCVNFTTEMILDFMSKFEFEGSARTGLVIRNLSYIRDRLPQDTLLILLLGSEIEAEDNTPEFYGFAAKYAILNAAIKETFSESDNVILVNITDFITGQDCFVGCTNHFAKKVYHDIAHTVREHITKLRHE